jgi:hypothetical protein
MSQANLDPGRRIGEAFAIPSMYVEEILEIRLRQRVVEPLAGSLAIGRRAGPYFPAGQVVAGFDRRVACELDEQPAEALDFFLW